MRHNRHPAGLMRVVGAYSDRIHESRKCQEYLHLQPRHGVPRYLSPRHCDSQLYSAVFFAAARANLQFCRQCRSQQLDLESGLQLEEDKATMTQGLGSWVREATELSEGERERREG